MGLHTKILLSCGVAALLPACTADITAKSRPAIIVEGVRAPGARTSDVPPPDLPPPSLPGGSGRIPWRAPDMTKDLYQEGR